jgi:hypothetical protein
LFCLHNSDLKGFNAQQLNCATKTVRLVVVSLDIGGISCEVEA